MKRSFDLNKCNTLHTFFKAAKANSFLQPQWFLSTFITMTREVEWSRHVLTDWPVSICSLQTPNKLVNAAQPWEVLYRYKCYPDKDTLSFFIAFTVLTLDKYSIINIAILKYSVQLDAHDAFKKKEKKTYLQHFINSVYKFNNTLVNGIPIAKQTKEHMG